MVMELLLKQRKQSNSLKTQEGKMVALAVRNNNQKKTQKKKKKTLTKKYERKHETPIKIETAFHFQLGPSRL